MTTDGATSGGSPLALEGTVFDARFRVEERIAEGGFAVVYKAWQLALERRVALKVLKAPRHQDAVGRAEFRERFAAEAKTIAKLRHPDIVDVYDFSVATLPSGELAPWMALEWLDGETLAQHFGRRRRAGERGRDPRIAVDFLRPVMQALAHAHAHGIVHRDIKPSNIMVTETPEGLSLRVLDFGIAKIMTDNRAPSTGDTRTESTPVFSPAYAAPEQVAFSRTGPWTDVHALGLILAEVMTDEAPFSDPDPEAHLFEQVMARSRPTPASKGRDVGVFEPILAKALALSPRDRWRDARELLAALDGAKAARLMEAVRSASVVGFVGEAGPPRAARTPRATGVLALVAVSLIAVWALRTRHPSPTLRRATLTSETNPTRDVLQIERMMTGDSTSSTSSLPDGASAGASSVGPPASAAVARPSGPSIGMALPRVASAASTPKSHERKGPESKDKTRVSAALAPGRVEDGRDVFNDTK